MKTLLLAALDATGDGFSPDRVVADPDLNVRFVAECVRLGVEATAAELNRRLLNLRKRGELAGRKSRRTVLSDLDEYRFAAEIAIRFLERRDSISLDDVICDPAKAAEFDKLAATIAPGNAPFNYRWAALNLRKLRKLEPELLVRVAKPVQLLSWPVPALDINSVPREQGLYFFYTSSTALYVGEAQNLRTRITKHLDHSDNKGLARWLWDHGSEQVHLELQVLDTATSTRVRKALETELIRSRKPVFNVKEA